MTTVNDRLMKMENQLHAFVIDHNEQQQVKQLYSKNINEFNKLTKIQYNYNYNSVLEDEFFQLLTPQIQ